MLTLLCLLLMPGFSTTTGPRQNQLVHLPASPTEPESISADPSGHALTGSGRGSGQMADVSHLELLVVVGADVQQIHRQDTEKYVLTNLNIAAELLRDASLGANLRVHLVRMIVLSEPEPDIQMCANISASLRSVCEWGRRINPPSDSDPLHADLLLYITRYDLELRDGNKQVRGVAQLGGACSAEWSCVISEDTGFDLGITIAHELGHSFGIHHDGVGNTCSGSGFMMASDGGYHSVDLTWSSCSRQQLQVFFSEGKADCVKDLPALGGPLQDGMPGLYFGVDDQCRIAFGRTARACSFTDPGLACRVLSCHVKHDDESSCRRLLLPLLDGTECAPNQWCLKGQCVAPHQFGPSVVVNGSWSSWSEFSSCSRTCGGGITLRTRTCNNPRAAFGGTDCAGPDVEAELCKLQPCEGTQLDFMADQCSRTDSDPLDLPPGSLFWWIPAVGFVKGDEQCRFMCRPDGENFAMSRGSQFEDGTRCEFDTPPPFGSTAACLRGRCQLFGCDGVMHSGKVWDVCGVCDGNGSMCTLTSASYTAGRAREYTTFLSVPVNATQVQVVNRAPLFTHLAVMVGGRYVVSGNGSMSLNVTHPSLLEENHIKYRLHLTPDLLPEVEVVEAPGPLKQEIHIQVYRNYGKEFGDKTDPNISCQYYVPNSLRSSDDVTPGGKWALFTKPCSVTCGPGVQEHVNICVDEHTNNHLQQLRCPTPPPPAPPHSSCQLSPCAPVWETGEFGVCSASCGGGVMVRAVRCVTGHGSDPVTVPDSECAPETAPSAAEQCNLQPCPARWRVSESGTCSAECGPGKARREVSCVRQDVEVDPSFCPRRSRPPDWVPCVVHVCPVGWESKREDTGLSPRSRASPVYVWSPSTSRCSKTCGNGTMQVRFTCVDHGTQLSVPDARCDASSRPDPQTGPCSSARCPPAWRSKPGVCSVTCGGGVAKRVLYCAREAEEVVEDSQCSQSPRPAALVPCSTHSCPPRWKVLSTSACSASCGPGVALRNVSCVRFVLGKDSVLAEDACSAAAKPAPAVPCLVTACTFRWEVSLWSQCSVPCGYGVQSRAVTCMGPARAEPLSPLLCMHLPKPITIRGCSADSCTAVTETTAPSPAQTASPEPPTAPPAHQPGACGKLLLDESGRVDLKDAAGRCSVSIGRPLDEVIHVKVTSGSLSCSRKEYVAFFDRLALVRRCSQAAGSEILTRTNVLLVRQNLLTPGNGVQFTYRSQKNPRKSHLQSCDVQLFASSGLFENPVTANSSQTCRVLITAPPAAKIRIQALHVALNVSRSTYIMVRDTDVLKTNVFRGPQLFLWHSSGSMAEVEFHGEYVHTEHAFRAQYSFI